MDWACLLVYIIQVVLAYAAQAVLSHLPPFHPTFYQLHHQYHLLVVMFLHHSSLSAYPARSFLACTAEHKIMNCCCLHYRMQQETTAAKPPLSCTKASHRTETSAAGEYYQNNYQMLFATVDICGLKKMLPDYQNHQLKEGETQQCRWVAWKHTGSCAVQSFPLFEGRQMSHYLSGHIYIVSGNILGQNLKTPQKF